MLLATVPGVFDFSDPVSSSSSSSLDSSLSVSTSPLSELESIPELKKYYTSIGSFTEAFIIKQEKYAINILSFAK